MRRNELIANHNGKRIMHMLKVKEAIVGTAIGRVLMSARDRFGLLFAAYKHLEMVGTIANDQLATLLVTRLCQATKTFVDVGAHIGSVIAAVQQCDASIKIVAIEAIPDKASRLRAKFPRVDIHECAVGDQKGEIPFYINTKDSGYSSLGRPTGKTDRFITQIKVRMEKLDDLVSHDNIDVIKIDVEGAELAVLRGTEKIIAHSRPIIMFESGPGDPNGLGYSKTEMWRFFAERNYVIQVPNRVAHDDGGLSEDGFVESHVYPRRTTNYFAIASERRSVVRDAARRVIGICTP
jgi:FkbM family methyltransferase